jgi:hypothetical protein
LALDLGPARDALQSMDFRRLYIDVLGWYAPNSTKPLTFSIPGDEESYTLTPIAEMSGVSIFEIQPRERSGKIPGANSRRRASQALRQQFREHLLIFLDGQRTQSLWYLLKREGQRDIPREHLYVKGQPGDLALGKLESMVFDLGELEKQTPGVLEVAKRIKDALDVERVTKDFYRDFKEKRDEFAGAISGIDNERDRKWYVSVLLNRLMFIYFLQRKFFLDNGNGNYLQDKLNQIQAEKGPDHYYDTFLRLLFFEGFAVPRDEWSDEAKRLLGNIKYLNGGLFLPHRIEQDWPNIAIPDSAFVNLFKLFTKYTWNLDDTPGGKDNELRPHVLGYIFEKYINQKSLGAYYTRPEITDYLCERTIHEYILQRINASGDPQVPGGPERRTFESFAELMLNLDARLCRELLNLLPTIRILDPACGSGAFLVSALDTLVNIYSIIVGKIELLHDPYLTNWLQQAQKEHASFGYYLRKKIITENLFGVDLMEEAMEIAKLRLFITLVSSVNTVDQLEPLPNIDFNILPGNSLIGFLHVNEERLTQLSLIYSSFNQLVAEKNLLISQYKSATKHGEDLRSIRNQIDTRRAEANAELNQMLLDEFRRLNIKYEEATWDASKQAPGKTLRRDLRIEDIADLHPFHWGYEFDQVMEGHGGFDIIIANPPWEALKPQAKEFFALHESTITKNKMRIEDFEREQSKLLQNAETRQAWLKYQNAFPYQSSYFRASPQYANQVSLVNGKKQGTDINLYKLFIEQCYNLLREGGLCGLVVPSGIYTDLGAKQLRELLFTSTRVTGLFGFENNKAIFEGVHRSFKFVVLTYEKGGSTTTFPAAFMRHEVSELVHFPQRGALEMPVDLIRQLSPGTLSIMEFKNPMDVRIISKMQKAPALGERSNWNFALTNEFHMTNDSSLFETGNAPTRLPLFEGKMIHQYTHTFAGPRYWIDEREGKDELIRREMRRVEAALDEIANLEDEIKLLSTRPKRVARLLEKYNVSALSQNDIYIAPDMPRLAFRDVARNTDARTLIATILPPNVFASNTLNYLNPWYFNAQKVLSSPSSIKECYEPAFSGKMTAYFCGVLNSFTLDYFLRFKVSAHVNMFYLYQLPVPRISEDSYYGSEIASRVAQLVCVGPEFDELRQELLGDVNASVATNKEQRQLLRCEIDALVTHLYKLKEEELEYVLSTFPLVEQAIKDQVIAAYHEFAPGSNDFAIKRLLAQGESKTLEFKVAACWNAALGQKDDKTRNKVLQEVAAFLNSPDGGTLLIGVADDGTVVGLENDYPVANPHKPNKDGYEQYLRNHIRNFLYGGPWHQYYSISFGMIQGKEICRIDVKPAPEPVYTSNGGTLYVREGTISRPLNPQETMDYIKKRWP